jgi:hypothetical protein
MDDKCQVPREIRISTVANPDDAYPNSLDRNKQAVLLDDESIIYRKRAPAILLGTIWEIAPVYA